MKAAALLILLLISSRTVAECLYFESALRALEGSVVEVSSGQLKYAGKSGHSCVITAKGNPNDAGSGFSHQHFFPHANTYLKENGWEVDIDTLAEGGNGGGFSLVRSGGYCELMAHWDAGWCCGSDTATPPEKQWYEITVECAITQLQQ